MHQMPNTEDMIVTARRETWQREHTELPIHHVDFLMGWLHHCGPIDCYRNFHTMMNTIYHSPRHGVRHGKASLVRLPDSLLFDILSYTLQALPHSQADDRVLKVIRSVWTAVRRYKRNLLLEHHAKRMHEQGYSRVRIDFGVLSLDKEPAHATVQ